jgi:hypothetical protein
MNSHTPKINLHLDEADHRALLEMARADCRPLREQLRYLVRDAARRRGLIPPPTTTPEAQLCPAA